MPKPSSGLLATHRRTATSQNDAYSTANIFDTASFVDNAHFGVYRIDLNGKPLTANLALAQLNGYDSVAELFENLGDVASEWYVDKERRGLFLDTLLQHGSVEHFESEIYRHKTRERIWVLEDAWLVCDKTDQPLYYEGTVKDITKRKEQERFQFVLSEIIEETLRVGPGEAFYEALLRRAVQSIPGAQAGSILLFDDNHYRYVAALGYDLNELSRVTFEPHEMPRKHSAKEPFVILPNSVRVLFGKGTLVGLETSGRLRDIRAALNIPIVLGEHPLAIINLDNFESEDAFGDKALELAGILSNQLVTVLSRFQLERAITQRQDVLEASATFHHSLLEFIGSSLQEGQREDFYTKLLQEAVQVVPGAQAGSILLKQGGRFHFVASQGFEGEALQAITFSEAELRGNSSEPYRLILRETPIVTDIERRNVLDTAGRVADIKVSLSIPILSDDEVVAFLFLDNFETQRAFNDNAVNMSRIFAEQIGVLLSRFDLERHLSDRQNELSTWGEFHQGLMELINDSLQQGLDANFYQRLLERAVNVVPGAQIGSIILRNEQLDYCFVASVGFDLQALQTVVLSEKDLFFDLTNPAPQLIRPYQDYQNSNKQTQKVLENSGKIYDIAVTLGIPIWTNNRPVALFFLDNLENPDAFHSDAIQMADGFARQVAVLLQRLELERELRFRQEALERWEKFRSSLLLFMSETLKRGLDESFYQRLLEHAANIIPGADAASIMTRRNDGRYAYVAAIGHEFSELRKVTFAPHEVFGLRNHNQPHIIHNVSSQNLEQLGRERSSALSRASEGKIIQTLLAIPVVLDGETVASLSLDAYQKDAFSPEALEMAAAFGTQIGLLLQRLSLEQELTQRQSALEHWSVFRSRLIHFINDMLAHSKGQMGETFYQMLLQQAAEVIPGVEAGSILRRDGNGLFHFVAALNFDLAGLQTITLAQHELYFTISEHGAAHVNQSKLETIVYDEARMNTFRTYGRLHEIGSSLSLPVMIEGQIAAVLNLNAFRTYAFSPEAQEMAKVFAAQIGVLLQRLSLEHELEQSNLELAKLANYDALTGLPNRALFADRLTQAITQSSRQDRYTALLFLDLDGFKLINDSLGHSVGDELLKHVAERLVNCVRDDDTVARLGGDEFTIILSSLKAPHDTIYVAENVLHTLSQPFLLDGRELHIGASIGITIYPDDGGNAQELVQHADTAMYHAKALGKNRYHFFTSELNARALEQLRLENDMRRGLLQGEFSLVYQPRVQLKNSEMTSLEALARWHHPELGLISPSVFIPIAEKSNFIQLLGREVLRQACQQAKLWQEAGHFLRVAVNVSVKQLQQGTLVDDVTKALTESGLDPKWLELEITESAAMTDVESNIGILKTLREMGVYISVDDFGTAYSSLNYLKRLPVNSLKIDKSFVEDISDTESADTAIVQAVIALGKSLGFSLIAEGVEDNQQLSFLRGAGCDEAQGYWFARPMSAQDTLQWFSKYKSR